MPRRIAKPALASLFIQFLLFGQNAPTPNPVDLLQQARTLLASYHGRVSDKIIPGCKSRVDPTLCRLLPCAVQKSFRKLILRQRRTSFRH